MGVESINFYCFAYDVLLWNVFLCLLYLLCYRTAPIFKTRLQFENLVFVIMSTMENTRLIDRASFNIHFSINVLSILNNAREVIQSNNENNFYTDYCTISSLDTYGFEDYIFIILFDQICMERLQPLFCLPGFILFS